MAVSSRSGGWGVEWSWACRPRRGVAKRGNCGPFGTGSESHAPGSQRWERRRAEPWSDVAEGAVFEKDGTPRFVLAVESLRGFPKEALTRRIIQARDCAMRVDEDGALGHIGGRWCVGSQGRGRVDRSRIARNGPRNERRRRRLGSRCSDAQEGNRVSVRPERIHKSSEEHRERWRVVLVE